ncbi:MAG: hypothetical protein H7Y17_12600, partial [Chlorobia bacterium]|nr:hypothetical protein [Fimbriimonadaceae bacterium]
MADDSLDAVSIAKLSPEELHRRQAERDEAELSACPYAARGDARTLIALRHHFAKALTQKHRLTHFILERKSSSDDSTKVIPDLELQLADVETRIEKMKVWMHDLSRRIEHAKDDYEAGEYSDETLETARRLLRERRKQIETTHSKVGEAGAGEFGSAAG